MTKATKEIKEPTLKERVEAVEDTLDALSEGMDRIIGMLDERVEQEPEPEMKTPLKPEGEFLEQARRNVVPGMEQLYEIIDEELGSEFELTFGEGAEAGTFLAEIVIPTKYDRRTEAERKMYPLDKRIKVIPVVGGADTLRGYAKLVRGNVKEGNPTYIK